MTSFWMAFVMVLAIASGGTNEEIKQNQLKAASGKQQVSPPELPAEKPRMFCQPIEAGKSIRNLSVQAGESREP